MNDIWLIFYYSNNSDVAMMSIWLFEQDRFNTITSPAEKKIEECAMGHILTKGT